MILGVLARASRILTPIGDPTDQKRNKVWCRLSSESSSGLRYILKWEDIIFREHALHCIADQLLLIFLFHAQKGQGLMNGVSVVYEIAVEAAS